MLPALLLAFGMAAAELPPQPAERWIEGRWYWDLPSGDPRLGGYARYTLRDGELLREGYPPLRATARYVVERVEGDQVVLRLSEPGGEQGYMLGATLALELDRPHDRMTIGGQGPFRREAE